jgi:nitrate reductase beta subunit
MSKIAIKTGDTSAGPRVRLVDRAGESVNLTGATVVQQVEGRPGVSFPVTVEDATGGVVRIARGDLTVPSGKRASWRVEFQVTFADSTVQTYPESGFVDLEVWSQLDAT